MDKGFTYEFNVIYMEPGTGKIFQMFNKYFSSIASQGPGGCHRLRRTCLLGSPTGMSQCGRDDTDPVCTLVMASSALNTKHRGNSRILLASWY